MRSACGLQDLAVKTPSATGLDVNICGSACASLFLRVRGGRLCSVASTKASELGFFEKTVRCKEDGGSEKKALGDYSCAAGHFLEGQQECALVIKDRGCHGLNRAPKTKAISVEGGSKDAGACAASRVARTPSSALLACGGRLWREPCSASRFSCTGEPRTGTRGL